MGRRTASAFPFDLDGNLLEEPLTRHEVRRYGWDAENQMVETWVERRKCRQGGHDEDRDGWQDEDDEDDSEEGHRQGHSPRSPHRRFLQRYGYASDGLKVRTQAFQGRPERLSETSLRFWDSGAMAEERIFSEKGCRGHHEGHAHHRDRRELADRRQYVRSAGGRIVAELKDPVCEGALAGTGHGVSAKADRFYMHDVLGSTVATAGLSLKDLENFSFDPWGNLVKEDEAARDVRHLFTGAARENSEPGASGEDEIYSMAYRSYRPGLSRWASRDPAKADGGNWGSYVRNRPLGATDLRGLALFLIGPPEDRRTLQDALQSAGAVFLSAGLPMTDPRWDGFPADNAFNFGSNEFVRLTPTADVASRGGSEVAATEARRMLRSLHDSSRNYFIGFGSHSYTDPRGGGGTSAFIGAGTPPQGFTTLDTAINLTRFPMRYVYQTGCPDRDVSYEHLRQMALMGLLALPPQGQMAFTGIAAFHSLETVLAHELFGHGWSLHASGAVGAHSDEMRARINFIHRTVGRPEVARLAPH